MKIEKIVKKKNNQYELLLSTGDTYILYDDIIIKHYLLVNKEISKDNFDKIIVENDSLESYYLALKYISRKMRSILEIENYLRKKEFNETIINTTVKKLIKDKYLDDDKFMQSYINDQFNLTTNGPNKIKFNLTKLGIDENKINIDKDFNEKLVHLINKKQKSNHKLSTEALKINISNYLSNLGYPRDMYIDLLYLIKADDTKFIQKDYEKLLNKYKNKYEPIKLKVMIKNNLYQKGYKLEDINKVIEEEV